MRLLRSVLLAFSMFSRLPVPKVAWEEENMRYMLAGFPLIGAVIGLGLFVWSRLCQGLGFNTILTATGLSLIPLAITGGIHLDGFCDTIEALSSHAQPSRKCEILKDPHIGAFAVMGLVAYLLLYFALCTELPLTPQILWLLTCVHVLSRVLSAFSVVFFAKQSGSGSLRSFADAAQNAVVCPILYCLLVGCAAVLLAFSPVVGTLMLLSAGGCLAWLKSISIKEFGGMRGDLAGFFLQVFEMTSLAILVLGIKGGLL